MRKIRFENIYSRVRGLLSRYSEKTVIELFPEKSTLNFIDGNQDYITSLFKD